MDKLGGTKPTDKDVEALKRPKKSNRRHLLNNLFDIIAIAASTATFFSSFFILIFSFLFSACLIFALIYLIVKPFQRGFHCDDTSIQYPYKPDTIPMWLLAVYGGVGPIIIVRFRFRKHFKRKFFSISLSSSNFGWFVHLIVVVMEISTR